jgi:(Z)-2-((N-methylformamido)methylene)-5-hydroxybutyrolactone dehydrogenase
VERFQHYIGGRFEDGSESWDSVDPATGTPWATMPAATAGDVDRAVDAADRALAAPEWAGLTATARGRLLWKLADLIERDAGRLARLETRDTGKILRETMGQTAYSAEYYRYYAGLADKLEGAHLPVDKPDMQVWTRREPIGVVAAIVPWNSQLFLSAVKIAPALAAGCTVVLKASEDGPAPMLEFARLVDEAGFPPGVLNIVTGFGAACGQTLTSHPKVARVAFTGGPETAQHVVRNTATNLAHVTLELGGKSPVVVFDDVDPGNVAGAVMAGIFGATGQSCVAGSRLLVHADMKDRLLDVLKERAERIVIGPPDEDATQIGPLATRAQLERIEQVVATSLEQGARLVTGGARPEGMEAGWYYRPTILDCSDPATASARTELFGPVLSVLTFRTEEEAIRLANDTPYGLAAGIFTNRLARAHRMIAAIRAGVVWVNTYRAISPIVPFGGFGRSGLGREAGAEAMLDYTRPKAVWMNTSDAPIPDPFVMR